MAASGNIVGEVGLIVKPVDPGFSAGVQRIIDKIERDAQFKVAADTRQAQESLRGIDSQVGDINNGLIQSAVNIAGITAAFFALKGMANQVVGKFSELFDQLAQAKAGFSSILKSDVAGNTLLAQVQEFARVSPFATQELVNYSQQLLGVGVASQQIVPLLEDVGNIISSVGGDTQNIGRVLFTLTQIKSIGRLAGQDAMQLQSALIPITKYLSEYLGKTTAEVKKLQEQGKISAETVFAAISAQGESVSGAMDKATRNIKGARAILSDTITIMLQNQPVLQQIFTDIYQSILTFSNYLSTPEVAEAIDGFFEQMGRVYEATKPVLTALADLGAQGGLRSLDIFTSTLSVLSTVLESIPEPVFKALALYLTAIATLKAPLMLIKYVQSFQNLSRNIMNSSVVLKKNKTDVDQQAASADKAAAANNRLAASFKQITAAAAAKVGGAPGAIKKNVMENGNMYAGLGLAMGGSMISDGNNGERDALGNMAQMAGMGAMIGGPWGAVAGAGIGAITSIVSASENAKKKLEADAKAAAEKWATITGRDVAQQYGKGSEGVKAFVGELEQTDVIVRNLTSVIGKWKAQRDLLGSDEYDAYDKGNQENWDKLSGLISAAGGEIKRYRQEYEALLNDPTFKPQLDAAAANLALLKENFDQIAPKNVFKDMGRGFVLSPDLRAVMEGKAIPETVEQLQMVEREAAILGLTWSDLTTKTFEEVTKIAEIYTRIPDYIKDSAKASQDWLDRLKTGQDTASTYWGSQKSQISAIISANGAITGALSAQATAAYDTQNATVQLTAQMELLTIKAEAFKLATASGIDDQIKAGIIAEQAYTLAIQFRQYATLAAAETTQVQTKEAITDLLTIASMADTLENRQIAIDISVANVAETLAEIQRVSDSLIKIGTSDLTPAEKNAARAAGERNLKVLQDQLVNGEAENAWETAMERNRLDEIAREKQAEEDARKAAEEAKRLAEEAIRKAEEWAANVKSATESLSDSVESAASAIVEASKAWIGSIKERTQYEQAVSTGRLIKNAQRQTSDVIEVASGLDQLRGRGVSQSVIDALGLNNVSDVKQIRKLLSSSDSELATLTSSVGGLDSAALSLAQREDDDRTRKNISIAIIDAATQLGLDVTKTQAASISNQFTITPSTNAEDIALQILNILTEGRISL